MAIMEVNVIPLGTETPSVGDYVTRAGKVLKDSYNFLACYYYFWYPIPRESE